MIDHQTLGQHFRDLFLHGDHPTLNHDLERLAPHDAAAIMGYALEGLSPQGRRSLIKLVSECAEAHDRPLPGMERPFNRRN